jgi:hypothetical protein
MTILYKTLREVILCSNIISFRSNITASITIKRYEIKSSKPNSLLPKKKNEAKEREYLGFARIYVVGREVRNLSDDKE